MTAIDRDVQALFDAAFRGDVSAIWSLLDADSSLVWESAGGLTALHLAAMAGSKDALSLLIAKRAAVNACGPAGTPLFQATLAGHDACVEALLAAGADANLATPCGETPLMAAAFGGDEVIGRRLLGAGAAVDAVTTAAASEISPDRPLAAGQSSLHLAAGRGQAGLVQLLLAHGADPSLNDAAGYTPFRRAAESGFERLAALLDR